MNILASPVEETLKLILSKWKENNNYPIRVTYDIFPEYISNNIKEYLDILKYNFFIARYESTLEDTDIYLTQEGIDYFKNKKIALFPKSSMELLKSMLETESAEEYIQWLFDGLDSRRDARLRAMMRELKEKKYIETFWADDVPCEIQFYEKAYQYEVNGYKEESQEKIMNAYNVENGNIYVGSTDSSIHITNNNSDIKDVFEKMLEVAKEIQGGDETKIIEAINEMKENSNESTFKEKYFKFMEVAAIHMTVFAPFLPALTQILVQFRM